MNKRFVGTHYEKLACDFLEKKGYEIISTNFRNRYGEIDIIAKDKEYLVFIEVKYRKTNSFGDPSEAVNLKKQINICRVSDYYRVRYKISSDVNIRFDVVAISDNEISLIQNAFEYIGGI